MANRTDPLIASVSGTDPQNLMEYITRQRIYDSRYWKEECFGLSVADVLEKAAQQLQCIGGFPTRFLALTLKLLQLHPDTDLMIDTFIQQEDFKYVRALGCLYVRLTGRPVEIYQTLEPLYRDYRPLRVYSAPHWQLLCMDEFIHQLLSTTTSTTASSHLDALNMALPRLPARRTLVEAGYISEERRRSVLQPLLDEDYGGDPLAYLRHKAFVEHCPAAIALWEKRHPPANDSNKSILVDESMMELNVEHGNVHHTEEQKSNEPLPSPHETKAKKKSKKQRNYDNLFSKKSSSSTAAPSNQPSTGAAPEEGSEEYWNEQRSKLGLAPLR
jgi:pre-mRNA-splicing factor 38A